tara:strand:+ start:131 stop:310 length:180 start_codon:yes stop_codon:yes gene_type:complete
MCRGLIPAIISFLTPIFSRVWGILYYLIKIALKEDEIKKSYPQSHTISLNDLFIKINTV